MEFRDLPERFLVALTFSGEERPLIEALAVALEERLGRGLVYYDDWFRHYFVGDDADVKMQRVYLERTELVVLGVSGSYGAKPWTRAEHRAVRSLDLSLSTSARERDRYRILQLRVGDGEVQGVLANTVALDIRNWPVAKTVDLIVNRLQLASPRVRLLQAPERQASLQRHVFLAACTPDLEDPALPINRTAVKRQLEGLGWRVLPDEDGITEGRPAPELHRDLRRSEAYVQLVGPHAWQHSGHDRGQYEAAVSAGIPRYVFRSDAIDLAAVEPPDHRLWLQQLPSIVCSFDDFLVHLSTGLGPPRTQRSPSVKQDGNGIPPLIRVAIHASAPDALWERVFPWIDREQGMLVDQLPANESFVAKHADDPCQGFLILCDRHAADDGPNSPRNSIQQCRQIQLAEKDPTKRPPVAVVYWPPPAAQWPRLLRSTTQKLRYTQVADDRAIPPELAAFFEDVRRAT